MYRETPDSEIDSGWRFFAGDESQEYVNDPNNLCYYDLNTICNYDPSVVSLIYSPVGSSFEFDPETGKLEEISDNV